MEMSNYLLTQDNMDRIYIKYINIVIRRPQYGKTSICMETIKRQDDAIHIILTMNTIKANNQFFERCNKVFANQLCIFNSKKPMKGDYEDEDEYKNAQTSHATTVLEVRNCIINESKNIIIACCHPKRFQNSIQGIIDLLEDSRAFNKKICIHIDEIHEYVRKNREYIEGWNDSHSVKDITGYSATPFKTWDRGIWEHLYIVDTLEEISDPEYFGVKDAEVIVFSDIDEKCIDLDIPEKIDRIHTGKPLTQWYTKDNTYFDCGDEHTFLCFVKSVITRMRDSGDVCSESFSYNFVPGYKRKATHLGIAFIISEIFPDAVIFVFNGDPKHGNRYMHMEELHKCPEDKETARQIRKVKEMHPKSPFFVTGFMNVNMSVTLINEKLGNFNNVVFSHDHYIAKQPDVLYQMCRFLFRYSNWRPKYKKRIKHTKVWCNNNNIINTCLNYEQDVINAEKMGGSLRTIEEVTDRFANIARRVPVEKKHDSISKHVEKYEVKQYHVYDKSIEDMMWGVVKKQYKDFKEVVSVPTQSIPPKNAEGFHNHSFSTTQKGVFTEEEILKKLNGMAWHSNYQLIKNHLKYARIYVGYKNKEDSSSYTIFLRIMQLANNDTVLQHLSSQKSGTNDRSPS